MTNDMENDLKCIEEQVDCLSNAMIIYELNGRGVAAAKTLKRRQSQLAQIIANEGSFPSESFKPPIGTKKDLEQCEMIVKEIDSETQKGPVTVFKVDQWLNKLEFISVRLKRLLKNMDDLLNVDTEDSDNHVAGAEALNPENEEKLRLKTEIEKLLDKVAILLYDISNISYSDGPSKENDKNAGEDGLHAHEINKNDVVTVQTNNSFKNGCNQNTIGQVESCSNDKIGTSDNFPDRINRFRFDSMAGLNISNIPINNPDAMISIRPRNPWMDKFRSNAGDGENNTNRNVNNDNNGRTSLDNCNYRPKVPIHKWKVKFSGRTGTISATEFIQQINELIVSRNSSHYEVFLAAPELFEGDGLKWLRTQSDCRNWQQLMQRLVSDFESPDFAEDLLDYIKSRKQAKNERVVIFITNMENMFLKLGSNVPGEIERCRIIKKNLLPDYVKHMSLLRFEKVASLKEACKDVEASYRLAESYENQIHVAEKSVRFENDGRQSRYDNYYGRNQYSGNYTNRTSSFEKRPYYNNNGRFSGSPSADNNHFNRNLQSSNTRSPSPYYNVNRNDRSHSPNVADKHYTNSSNQYNRGYSPAYNNRNGDSINNQRPRQFSNDRARESARRQNDENSGNLPLTTRQGYPASQSPNRSPKRQ